MAKATSSVDSSGTTPSPCWSRFVRALTWLAALAVWLGAVSAIVYFGTIDKDAAILGEVLTFCFATFVLLRFPSIIKFKAMGVEFETLARVRDDALAATDAAKATVEQLRRVGAALGKVALQGMAMHGHFGEAFTPAEKVRSRQQILDALQNAGCSAEELAAARVQFDQILRQDLVRRAVDYACKILRHQTDPTIEADANRLVGEWAPPYKAATAIEIRDWLKSRKVDEAPATRRVTELELFDQTGEPPDISNDAVEETEVLQRRPPKAT